MDDAHEKKLGKYLHILDKFKSRFLQPQCEPITIERKEFAEQSLCKMLPTLAVTDMEKNKAIRSIRKTVEEVSRWLWPKRASD